MNRFIKSNTFLFLLTFLFSSAIRFVALNQTRYANGWDGYYYIMQVYTFLEDGKMRAPDYSLIYPYFIIWAYVLKDYILAFKIGASVLAGLFSLSVLFWVKKYLPAKVELYFISAFLMFSPGLTFFSSQFPKNLLGVTFFMFFLTAIREKFSYKIPVFFVLCFLSHRMAAGLALLIAVVDFFSRRNKIYGIVFAAAAGLSLLLPGVLHIFDLQRFASSLFEGIHFAPLSFAKSWGVQQISAFWFSEMIVLYIVFLVFFSETLYSLYKTHTIQRDRIYLMIVLFILVFPFFRFSNGSIGYRFYLVFNLVSVTCLAFCLKYLKKVHIFSLALLLAGLSFFSYRSYDPGKFDPPYKLYYKIVDELNDYAKTEHANLIVAHQGIAQLVIIHTDIEATNWLPDERLDKSKIVRLAANIQEDEFKKYLTARDFMKIKVIAPFFRYSVLTEDVWEKFIQSVKKNGDAELLNRIGLWKNPVKPKPEYLLKGRKSTIYDRLSATNNKSSDFHKIKAIADAYPDFFDGVYCDSILIWKDGTRMVFDDGIRNKNLQQLLENPDPEDQFYFNYPKDDTVLFSPAFGSDPGRIRYEPFFRKMYGATGKEVENNLTSISWLPSTLNKKLKVTKINGVDKKLQAISDELDRLPDSLQRYVMNPGGTYYWRVIAGTGRLSAHSFGIAIDINADYSNYWRWDLNHPEDTLAYKNRIPMIIVKIFEKHGFIWGGRWYHYDTMHFEYRPELFAYSKKL